MKHTARLRSVAAFGYVASTLVFGATAAVAADYPDRPIRMIVPGAAAAAWTIVARLVANTMSESLKQSVVVENRPARCR